MITRISITLLAAAAAIAEVQPDGQLRRVGFQPTGAHDAYAKGAKVTFKGAHYISLIDANVYSPEAYPAGWQLQE